MSSVIDDEKNNWHEAEMTASEVQY